MLAAIKRNVKASCSPSQLHLLQAIRRFISASRTSLYRWFGRLIITPTNLIRNNGREYRCLEIGPGSKPVPGFETVNVVWWKGVHYVADATHRLPFADGTFDIVHASHVLEHTPWFSLKETLREWVRVLKPGGRLEIWVPDAYKLAKLLCDVEEGAIRSEWQDGWQTWNGEADPFLWINGRLLYGVRTDYPSWHTAVLTPRFLENLMKEQGLSEVLRLPEDLARGTRHGWINLGICGTKR